MHFKEPFKKKLIAILDELMLLFLDAISKFVVLYMMEPQ